MVGSPAHLHTSRTTPQGARAAYHRGLRSIGHKVEVLDLAHNEEDK
jgi:hypothetical protein